MKDGQPPHLRGDSEEMKLDFAYKWSMMSLTRAIDTLVITLKDPTSEYAQVLRKVSDEYEGFVEWLE
jgi:hypothetical protein